MPEIKIKDANKYPQVHIEVNIHKVCTMCDSPFTWSDYWLQRNPSGNNNGKVNNGICSHCQFWVDNFMYDRKRDYAIINGEHYIIGSKLEDARITEKDTLVSIAKRFVSNKKVKGMGGSKHIIKFKCGRIVITDDLWHQGTIPKHFNFPMFQDNAVFRGGAV